MVSSSAPPIRVSAPPSPRRVSLPSSPFIVSLPPPAQMVSSAGVPEITSLFGVPSMVQPGGGKVVSTVQVRLAAVGSALPAPSVALTRKVCPPSTSPEYFFGETHVSKAVPSRLHSKVDPGTEEEKSKLAEVAVTVPEGPESMVVSGNGDEAHSAARHPSPEQSLRLPRRASRSE